MGPAEKILLDFFSRKTNKITCPLRASKTLKNKSVEYGSPNWIKVIQAPP